MQKKYDLPLGISVIICTYNGAERILPTLKHLKEQQLQRHIPWEVLLIDNNSTDNTAQIARTYWDSDSFEVPLITIYEPEPGTDHARKRGAMEARFAYFVFCDDDNWLAPDFLQTGLTKLEEEKQIGVLGAQGSGVCSGTFPPWFASMATYYAAAPPATTSRDFTNFGVWGAGMFGRTKLLKRVFPPGIPLLNAGRVGNTEGSGEDGEICCRIALQGYSIWYYERLKFQHFISDNRLTNQYRDALRKKNTEPSQNVFSYLRLRQIKNMKQPKRFFFVTNQFLKFIFFKLGFSIPHPNHIIDYLYYYSGASCWQTTVNRVVLLYWKKIKNSEY